MDQVHLIGSPLIEEWMALQAEDIDHHMIEALALLAEYHERRGEYTQARQALDRLAGIAPWDETAQVQLIRLLALDQQWSAAQSRYYSLRRYLRDQLGIEPQPETATLFEDIRKAAHLNLPFSPRFPPARQNLTTPSTAFVGRQNALDNLAEMLAQPHARVITLLGPGGIGKTRLALEAARQQVGLFADGVFAVPLASAEGQEALVPGIASAAGFQFHGSESPESQLMAFFRDKDILFVLDNFEHLLSPVKTGAQTGENIHQGVNFLVEALNQSPRLRFMVTSRAPLNLQMERVVEVGGLDFPPSEDGAGCQDYAAVKLFDLMARRLQPHFSLEKEQRAVSQICRMLEGSPLAIELSAAWIPIHSPDEITLARSKPAWITWQLTSAMCPTAIAACAWFSNTP
jgi:tetratricopeptide (TPR) repeat protein